MLIDAGHQYLFFKAKIVPGGEELIPIINQLRQKFEIVAFTRDWHPENHVSFASMHQG